MATATITAATIHTGAEARAAVRSGRLRHPTSGIAPDFVQTNVAILPKDVAFDFLLFCQRNPKPCPVIEVMEPGQAEAKLSAPGSDIRTDVPKYRVYKKGRLADEPEDIRSYWRPDLVTFLFGCSFTFEHALIRNGIRLPYYGTDRNVAMFITNIKTSSAGAFSGPVVVSHRWIPRTGSSARCRRLRGFLPCTARRSISGTRARSASRTSCGPTSATPGSRPTRTTCPCSGPAASPLRPSPCPRSPNS